MKLRRTILFRKNYEKIYTLFLYKYNLQIPIEVLRKIFKYVIEDGNELLLCKYKNKCRAKYCNSYHKCTNCNEYFTNSDTRNNHNCLVTNDLELKLINISGCKYCVKNHYKENIFKCKNLDCIGINKIYQDTYKCYCCNYKTKKLNFIHKHYNDSKNCYKSLPSYLKIKLKDNVNELIY